MNIYDDILECFWYFQVDCDRFFTVIHVHPHKLLNDLLMYYYPAYVVIHHKPPSIWAKDFHFTLVADDSLYYFSRKR